MKDTTEKNRTLKYQTVRVFFLLLLSVLSVEYLELHFFVIVKVGRI